MNCNGIVFPEILVTILLFKISIKLKKPGIFIFNHLNHLLLIGICILIKPLKNYFMMCSMYSYQYRIYGVFC